MKQYFFIYARKSSEAEDRQCQSITDQLKILQELAASRNLQIAQTFTESYSAKAPGRPVFNEMIKAIKQRGDIKGILCWKLNRLFRNPVDEGNLRWMIQNQDIEEIHTPSKTYYSDDSDFVMAVEGSQAQRFIKDLRVDTMRGTQTKIEKGMAPLLAFPGYINNKFKDQGKRDISADPVQFLIMKKVFSLALTGNFSIQKLYEKATEMGLKNQHGRQVGRTTLYEAIKNPFYTGKFLYKGELHQGTHDPMISQEQYELVQQIYGFSSRPRYGKNTDLLNGVIKCACGGWITGDKKTKPSGLIFTYYKCSRKGKGCSNPQIPGKELYRQVNEKLSQIQIKQEYINWFVKWLRNSNQDKINIREAHKTSLQASLRNNQLKIDNLLNMKLSDQNMNGEMLNDEEYKNMRLRLLKDRDTIQNQLKGLHSRFDEIDELVVKTLNFALQAKRILAEGNILEKKTVLKALGSNLILNDGKLDITTRSMFKVLQDRITEINRIELDIGAIQNTKPSINTLVYPLQNDIRTAYMRLSALELLEVKQYFFFIGI
jgi:site-specific DNA recombinase